MCYEAFIHITDLMFNQHASGVVKSPISTPAEPTFRLRIKDNETREV
jgi:hypothetical protein